MKAGIYKTPNGNLIYVAKDRTIKATTLKPSTWPGTKVSQKGADVVLVGCYVCTRFSDVPNGCTDHQKALDDAQAANRAEVEALLGADGDVVIAATIDAMQRSEDPVRFSPAAAQLLAQTCNAELSVGEMVEAAKAQGYVEVPGTDELVLSENPADVIERLTGVEVDDNVRTWLDSTDAPRYAVGGPVGLREGEVPAILTQGREMSMDEYRARIRDVPVVVTDAPIDDETILRVLKNKDAIMRELASPKPFEGDLKQEADDPYKRYAELVYGQHPLDDIRFVGMSPARGLPYGMNVVQGKTCGAEKEIDDGRRFAIVENDGPKLADSFVNLLNVTIGKNVADTWAESFRSALRKQGWGICHSRSARKHRKRGDNVIPLRGGLFAWKGKLYPYQRDACRAILQTTMTVKPGAGKLGILNLANVT